MWTLPPDFDKTKKYPVIFAIYGALFLLATLTLFKVRVE